MLRLPTALPVLVMCFRGLAACTASYRQGLKETLFMDYVATVNEKLCYALHFMRKRGLQTNTRQLWKYLNQTPRLLNTENVL